MTDKKQPPRVYLCLPSRRDVRIEAAQSHYALATNGGCQFIPCVSANNLLANGFNKHWAMALNWQKAGIVDYFLMHHDDIEIRTPLWLDEMIMEMNRVGAAVLSVVQPIKDGKQTETSTAVETEHGPWRPRRMSFEEIDELPETFTLPGLLINTGLMLVDIRRPEFHELVGNELYFHFEINDRIVSGKDGMLYAQFRPEDWNFSRLCHARHLPVYATRKIECLHYGEIGFTNKPEKKHASDDGSAQDDRGRNQVHAERFCETESLVETEVEEKEEGQTCLA